ncbi:MAG TPA: DUF2721 domain-containing protein [Stellaceae bacterium]|jgi:hypothetical protein
MPGLTESAPLDLVAHVIQVALTPIFLLSGIATLLNVFSTRLARVADLIAKATEGADGDGVAAMSAELLHLRRRSLALDAAVVLAAIAGAATCASVLTLFVGALKDATVASVLFTSFGLAVVATMGAIGAFTLEMLMAGSGMRARAAAGRRFVEPG